MLFTFPPTDVRSIHVQPAHRSQRPPASPPARPQGTYPDPRWRHGHHDPELQAGRGRLPRRALRRLAERRERQQRPLAAQPPGRDPGHREGLPRRRRRHPRDQYLQRHPGVPGRLRHAVAGLRTQRRRGAPGSPGGGREDRRDPGQAALRRRRARPDQPHLLDFPGREQPRLPQRHLRRAGGELRRGDPRPDRGRRRPDPDRDHLRHPQCQGGDIRRPGRVRGTRRGAADHDLRDHHRRLRPHPVGPDHRGLLELGAACPADLGRPELRPRRQGIAAVHRGTVDQGRHPCLGPPQRRPAERLRRIRRIAGGNGRGGRGIRRRRLPQYRRRLLRHHPGAHRGDRQGSGQVPAAGHPGDSPGLPPVRSGAVHHRPQLAVRQRRRAHQHHRLGQVRPADPRGKLRGSSRGRPAAGGSRRPGDRHQHGRRHAGLEGGHGHLPQPDRLRARHLARADHDRLLQVGR
ncbi:Uncharacterised protein [Pseudomonas aeruginosa]|nr:Uncharacterised protein [Pseudomonas aeruginosa]